MKNLIEVRRDLHKIPEVGFKEVKTQRYLLTFLTHLPQDYLKVVTWKTGIVVKIEGSNPTKCIG